MKKVILLLFSISTTQSAPWSYGDIHIVGDSHSAHSFTNLYIQSLPPIPFISSANFVTFAPKYWPFIYEKSSFVYTGQDGVVSVPFQIHWINRTMHMIGKLGLEQVDFRDYGMKDGDFAVLTFGGLDSSAGSILKQYILGRELDEIIEKLTKNYIKVILANQRRYKKMNIVVVAATPPCILEYNRKAYVQRDPNLPFEKFMVAANRMLNHSLEHYCLINNFIYLDVTSSFEDQNGILRREMSDGANHINPAYNHIVKQKLIDLILDDIENEAA